MSLARYLSFYFQLQGAAKQIKTADLFVHEKLVRSKRYSPGLGIQMTKNFVIRSMLFGLLTPSIAIDFVKALDSMQVLPKEAQNRERFAFKDARMLSFCRHVVLPLLESQQSAQHEEVGRCARALGELTDRSRPEFWRAITMVRAQALGLGFVDLRSRTVKSSGVVLRS